MIIAPLFERIKNRVLGFVVVRLAFAALFKEVLHWVQAFRVIARSFPRSGAAGRYYFLSQEFAQPIDHENENPLGFGCQFVREMNVDFLHAIGEMDDAHSVHFRVCGVFEVGWMVRQKPVFAVWDHFEWLPILALHYARFTGDQAFENVTRADLCSIDLGG